MITQKSPREIEKMKKSAEILKNVLRALEEIIAPGITTFELNKITEEIISKSGAIPSFKGYGSHDPKVPPFPAAICTSVNDVVIHGIPNKQHLAQGDILSIDVGVIYNGYHSDAARTYAIGEVSETAKKLIEVTKNSFFKGIEKAVEGFRVSDISKAVQTYVESFGFSVVRDFVGHGIGTQMHEEPQIPNYAEKGRGSQRLYNYMAIAVEPMVNTGTYKVQIEEDGWTITTQDGSLSAHYENTLVITPKGPEILTLDL